MKLVGLASIVLFCSTTLIAEDFRGLEWGSTRQEVISLEGEDHLFIDEGLIVYEREMLDAVAYVKFAFEDGHLRSGYYDFPREMEHRVIMALYERFGAVSHEGRFGMKTWELGETDVTTMQDPETFIVGYYDAKYLDEEMAADRRAREEQQKEDAKAF